MAVRVGWHLNWRKVIFVIMAIMDNAKGPFKTAVYGIADWLKRQTWSLIVAYMVGLHNFYHGDNKNADDIRITVEKKEIPGDNAPE